LGLVGFGWVWLGLVGFSWVGLGLVGFRANDSVERSAWRHKSVERSAGRHKSVTVSSDRLGDTRWHSVCLLRVLTASLYRSLMRITQIIANFSTARSSRGGGRLYGLGFRV
jgi:hypothetical protein